MIVRSLENMFLSECHVQRSNWASTRLIVEADKMGFSLHVTHIYPGETGITEYPNHLEAAYCIAGSATLIFNEDSRRESISPGTVYALNLNDKHRMEVHEELVLVCVFSPALQGNENANKVEFKKLSIV